MILKTKSMMIYKFMDFVMLKK